MSPIVSHQFFDYNEIVRAPWVPFIIRLILPLGNDFFAVPVLFVKFCKTVGENGKKKTKHLSL